MHHIGAKTDGAGHRTNDDQPLTNIEECRFNMAKTNPITDPSTPATGTTAQHRDRHMTSVADVIVEMNGMHREINAHRSESERRRHLSVLLARIDTADALLEPLSQWAEVQDARKVAGGSVPTRRAALLTLAAMRHHARALSSVVRAGELIGDPPAFEAYQAAAGLALDLFMARSAQAAAAIEASATRARSGNRSAPNQNTLRADRDKRINDYLNNPGHLSPESAGVHIAGALAKKWPGARGAQPETITKLIRARQKKFRKE